VITIVHGGQTGVDRGGHEGAIANGWRIAGYMPSDARDERGAIPEAVARFLVPHDKARYSARTEANVASVNASLIVVSDMNEPRKTPGTAMTINMAAQRLLPCRIVDPTTDATQLALWILNDLLRPRALMLPLDEFKPDPVTTRLLVAGPRESKWRGAQAETTTLLYRIALAITEIRTALQDQELSLQQR
jgi:hypothetical protein